MKQFSLRYLSIVLFFPILAACQPYGPSAPLTTGVAPVQHSIRTTVIDGDVRNTLLFVNAVYDRLPGGQLTVQANFENRLYTQDVWADISIEFLNEHNMVVDKTEWKPTFFPAAQVTMVSGSSISPLAKKHVLLLRNLKTSNGRIVGPAKQIYEY